MATRFAKAPAGISAFSGETKGVPQREAEGLGPAFFHGKTTASWFRKARRCPRAPAGTSKDPIPLCLLKTEGGQAIFPPIHFSEFFKFLPRRISRP
jgi:hypothetical protein